AVEPHDFERLVLIVSRKGDRRGRTLAFDLDHVAFGDAERLKCYARHPRDAAATFLLPGGGDLKPDRALFDRRRVCVCHPPSLFSSCVPRKLGMRFPECKPAATAKVPENLGRPDAGRKKARLLPAGLGSLGEDA